MLKHLVLRAIDCYRDNGGGIRWFGLDCNFEPSCSVYAQQAIIRFGLYRGLLLFWQRIRRCCARDCICKCLEPIPENFGMLNQYDVNAEEERLRTLVQALPDEQRKLFFQEVKRQLRDPDTYAVLNWFFLAGLYHFYLGRWGRGMFNLALFLSGVVLIILQFAWLGIALILLVSLWELWALFRAQIIVQDWNNQLYRDLLKRYEIR